MPEALVGRFQVRGSRGVSRKSQYLTLWTAKSLTLYRLYCRFRHKITGVPSRVPTDVPGGILAGDMGLGQTLSMIATMVTTLAGAKSYVDSVDVKRKGHMSPTPATLVIVPSARK